MSDTPVQLLVAVFGDETSAEAALEQMRQAKGENLAAIEGAVVVRKDHKGNIHMKDVGLTPGKGAAAGVALGAVVGILTGGAGLVLGAAGGVIGGILGVRRREQRISSGSLNEIAVALPARSSAIVIAANDAGVEPLEYELEQAGAEVLTAIVAVDLAGKLEQQRDAGSDGAPK